MTYRNANAHAKLERVMCENLTKSFFHAGSFPRAGRHARDKYADAIVKNFANSLVMAILASSIYFFHLASNLDSWLGVLSVLVTTYVYMNIAIKLSRKIVPSEEKSGPLK